MQRFLNISIFNNSRIIDTLFSASQFFQNLNFTWGIKAKAQLGPINKKNLDFHLTYQIEFGNWAHF